jgi:hypothetical protein
MAANGRPVSGAGVRFSSRLKRSTSRTTRGIGSVSPDRLIARQGATLVVNEEQLQLGPDGAGAGAEAGASQQPGQSEQAFLQAPLKPQVIGLVELLTLDRESHRRPALSH